MLWYWIVGAVGMVLAITLFTLLAIAKESDENSDRLFAELKGIAPAEKTPEDVVVRPVAHHKRRHQPASPSL